MNTIQRIEQLEKERDELRERANSAESLAVEWQQRHADLYVASEENRNRVKDAEQRLYAIQDLLYKADAIAHSRLVPRC